MATFKRMAFLLPLCCGMALAQAPKQNDIPKSGTAAEVQQPSAAAPAPQVIPMDELTAARIRVSLAQLSQFDSEIKRLQAEIKLAQRNLQDVQQQAQTDYEGFLAKNGLKMAEWDFDASQMAVVRKVKPAPDSTAPDAKPPPAPKP